MIVRRWWKRGWRWRGGGVLLFEDGGTDKNTGGRAEDVPIFTGNGRMDKIRHD